jgi:hypothetical protein
MSPELTAALKRLAGRRMSPEELAEQRVSFAFSGQDFDSPGRLTKDEVRELLNDPEGWMAKRHERAAQKAGE